MEFAVGVWTTVARRPARVANTTIGLVSKSDTRFGEQTKELRQRMMEGVQETEKAIEAGKAESRRQSEAA
jgi:hypothetical protein